METNRFHVYRPACVLVARGPDAREYLQGQFSADLGRTNGGERVYGLWLNRKGKIVADSFALCASPEEYWLVSYYCREATVRERLEENLVMDEVELLVAGEKWQAASLWGEAAIAAASALLPDGAAPGPRGATVRKGLLAFWGRRGGGPALELVFDQELNPQGIDQVKTALEATGAEAMDDEQVAALAIQTRTPRVGIDVGEDDLPQEVGLVEEAVAFDKGCFLGQEVMARLRSMGRARKRLARARFPTAVDALPASLLDASGKKRGELRSQVKAKSGYMGLAIAPVGWEDPLTLEGVAGSVTWDRD